MLRVLVAAAAVLALVGAGVGSYFAVASGGSGQETVTEATPTPTPLPTEETPPAVAPTPSPEPPPAVEPGVTIPDDWQTYVDPKSRFSIRVPPDWEFAKSSTENNPKWLQFNIPGESPETVSHMTDGVKLSVSVEPKQPGDTLEVKVPDFPELRRLTLDDATLNARTGLRASWGADRKTPSQIAYAFERGDDWVLVILRPVGARTREYIETFDDLIIKGFVIQ